MNSPVRLAAWCLYIKCNMLTWHPHGRKRRAPTCFAGLLFLHQVTHGVLVGGVAARARTKSLPFSSPCPPFHLAHRAARLDGCHHSAAKRVLLAGGQSRRCSGAALPKLGLKKAPLPPASLRPRAHPYAATPPASCLLPALRNGSPTSSILSASTATTLCTTRRR